MKILVIGGTRFFGIPMVNELLSKGHDITIATRGNNSDSYGDKVNRIILERTNEQSMKNALSNSYYDVVIDKIAYCSNDIKYVMEAVNCDKYIHMSSTAVYEPKHMNTVESDFDGVSKELVWCDRKDFSYGELKRQAECALWQEYRDRNWIAVRYPFVAGTDDYTKRLAFYVEHTMKSIPMDIDNLDSQMGFIRSDEAGKFMAFLVDQDIRGAIMVNRNIALIQTRQALSAFVFQYFKIGYMSFWIIIFRESSDSLLGFFLPLFQQGNIR